MYELQQRAESAAKLRLQAEQLIKDPAYSTEQLAQLLQELQQLLQLPAVEPIADYAAYLQYNLDWLQALMAKITSEKDAIAANMLELQRGRKATRSYGQNN
jgi:predicted GTPase